MRTWIFRCLAIALGVFLGGCSQQSAAPCTDILLHAITVEIRDAETNAPAAQYATLVVRNGAYADSATTTAPAALMLSAAPGRPGTYDVTVRKAGYQEWNAENVRVGGGRCHVDPVHLQARLESAG